MNPSRTLTLKREALRQLTADELHTVAGGPMTMFSCLAYISCNPVACLPTIDGCIER